MEQSEATITLTEAPSAPRIQVREFAARLVRLGLAEEAQLYRAVEEFPKEKRNDLGTLLEVLFDRGIITPWQAEQIAAQEAPLLTLAGYRLLAKIGDGLRGTVYLARFPQRDQVVALKIFRQRQVAEDEAVKGRLAKAKSLCRLEHPNIITTYDVGIDRGYIYQAMEFVGGQDLAARVVLHGRLSIAEGLRTLKQVAAGIEYLHQQRLVHGNLKPQNILITEHGVKILDVLTTQIDPPIVVDPSAAAEKTLTSHIAARFSGYEAPESAILDALAYLGPEQLRVPPHDEVRSDIYAMGALCFYMLTGDPMFPGVTPEEMLARKLKGTTPALDNLRPDAPRDLCEAITQTLANDPSSRYPSTTLLLRTIDRELEGLSSAKSKGNEDQESPRSIASPRTSPAEQTRKQLEDMGLVRPAEWEKAAEQAGSTTNLTRILTELMGMRSLHTWRVEGGSPPILTRFQFDWINANQAAKLRLRDYLLRERLSEDGMVTVDRALNVRRERIDILHSFPRMHGRNRDKMLETLAIVKNLDHPSIGRLYEHFREDPFDVLAVEYIEGQNLRAHMEANYTSRGRTHAWRAAVEWGISLAEALAAAHSSGIRHGNLSPAKVMVTYSGAVKILAMGFGQLFFFSRGNPYASPPAVMAPEQWLDSTEITPASDLYQLGCTLHYLLTGKMPFQGKSLTELRLGHMERAPARISASRADVPEALDQIIGRLLAKSPQERYPDAAAIVADLKAVRGEDTAKPTPVITAPKPEISPAILPAAPTSDGPTLVSLFVALVVIATLILGIVYFLD